MGPLMGIPEWQYSIAMESSDRISQLDPVEVFRWYSIFYSGISELQSLIMHLGYPTYLFGSRLLSAYRDNGYFVNGEYYTATQFGIHSEDEWVSGSPKLGVLWNSILDFLNNDDKIAIANPPWIEITGQRGGLGGGGMQFNIIVKGDRFKEFPMQWVSLTRYCKPFREVILSGDDDITTLKNSITDRGSILSSIEEGLLFSFRDEWIKNPSVVYLYNSPFWTIGAEYIELWLMQRYGADWGTPISIESYYDLDPVIVKMRKDQLDTP